MPDSGYLTFEPVPVDRKTAVERVNARRGGHTLGAISWYGPWRQYVFDPLPGTVWSAGCLAEVQGRIGALMGERKAGRDGSAARL